MYIPNKRDIKKLALETPDEEICGFIYEKDRLLHLYPCKNIALNKHEEFEIDNQDYINAAQLGRIYAVYHSHPQNALAAFSEEDLDYSKEWCLPFYLYSVKDDKFLEYIPPTYNITLEGQEFCWGSADCYSLIRNYFRQNFQIYMNDYDRDETFESTPENIIMQNFAKENFHMANTTSILHKHDVLVFRSSRAYPQHFAIFMGNSKMLHHPLNALSRMESFNSTWQKRLECVFRYNKPLK